MSVAVITIAAGRHSHLRNQQSGLLRSERLPDVYVVVAMGDPQVVEITETGPLAGSACEIRTTLMDVGEHLPLAAARNLGARLAILAGARTLVFLDVDCIPSPTLVGTYLRSVTETERPALHCGVVRYLEEGVDPNPPGAAEPGGKPHPARPQPPAGRSYRSETWNLFWSLSFATSAAIWTELGGFHEEYAGYGAEDTDFGYHAHRAGVDLLWLGGADAHHQYHPTSPLPTHHLTDILRNATLFEGRWGFWPMQGWLDGFAEAGLARYDSVGNRWYACEVT